ncbi:MAG TPA: glycosyltransferase family 39 protein [Anaerolineales bacterium]
MEEARSKPAAWTERVRRAWQRSGLREVLPIFLTVRVGLSLWMFLVRQIFSQAIPPDPVARPYLGVAVETNPWLEPWQRWDTLHYQAIAERGYGAFDSALFVPPLYPGLIRLTSRLIYSDSLLSALIVSNVAALAGMAAFYSLARAEAADPSRARRAVLYLSIFPTGFFWFAGYTESLLLLFSSVALLAARRSRWLVSGLAAGLAALSRLTGALLIVPVGASALLAVRKDRSWRPIVAAGGALLGALAFPLYVWLGMGLSPLAPIEVQAARAQGGFAFPGVNLTIAIQRLAGGEANFADLFDLALLLLFIGLAVPVWRQLSRPLALFYLGYLLLHLSRVAEIAPLLGMARYVLVLFPAYLVLAGWGRRPWIHRLIVYLSAAGLLLLSGQFAIWGWVG